MRGDRHLGILALATNAVIEGMGVSSVKLKSVLAVRLH